MSSFVGVQGQLRATTYAATKGAITSFSKALAVEEARNNVRVNVVSPGNIWTPLWRVCLYLIWGPGRDNLFPQSYRRHALMMKLGCKQLMPQVLSNRSWVVLVPLKSQENSVYSSPLTRLLQLVSIIFW